MDLGLSEEQELLKNSAREFLEKECPEEHVRAMEEDDRGYSPDLWKKMADLGWQGLMIPEDQGGAGFSFLDLCVLVEEFGRALVPGPFIPNAVCAAELILAGSDGQKSKYLPKIADGSAIHTYAITIPIKAIHAGMPNASNPCASHGTSGRNTNGFSPTFKASRKA